MSMDESALKSHFEVILGRPLEIGEGIPIRIDVGTSNQEVNASVTSRNLGTTGESTKTCLRHLMLDVTGTARTGPDGRVSFLLSDFHCLDNVPFQGPLNFVATPLEPRQSSAGPVFLTATRFLNPPGDERRCANYS